jgi:hypothetical protein
VQAARDGRGDVRARGVASGADAGVHVQQDGGHRGAARGARHRRRRRRLPRHAAQQGAHSVSALFLFTFFILSIIKLREITYSIIIKLSFACYAYDSKV